MIAPLHLNQQGHQFISLSVFPIKQKERKMFSDNVSYSFKIFNFRVMSKSSSKNKILKKLIYATGRGNSMPRG